MNKKTKFKTEIEDLQIKYFKNREQIINFANRNKDLTTKYLELESKYKLFEKRIRNLEKLYFDYKIEDLQLKNKQKIIEILQAIINRYDFIGCRESNLINDIKHIIARLMGDDYGNCDEK